MSEPGKNLTCRLFGHRKGFVDDPANPLNITRGCVRCKYPATFSVLVRTEDDPTRPGYVKVQGLDKLSGWLEAQL